jgi:CheY-like chemotaxis protein
MSDGPLRLLVVDDDELPPEALARAFRAKKRPVEMHVASGAEEAWLCLRGSGGEQPMARPVLVLLDLNMPGVHGLEWLDELRADPVWRSTVVFAFSTSDDPRDIRAAYDRHVAGYLVKQRIASDYGRLVDLLDRYWQTVRLPLGS